MSLFTRLKGKLVRPVADAAGDRRAEAKAHLEAATGDKPDNAAVDDEKVVVRERHHDTLPEP